MSIVYQERLSDSPYVDTIGHFHVESDHTQICAANILWNMMVVKYAGIVSFSVWKPDTKPGVMNFPAGAEFLFIRYRLGCFMPGIPVNTIAETGLFLPESTGQSFWLDSATWHYPDYENADTFVDWLVREGLLVHEPVVDTVLQEQSPDIPLRTARYRFVRATGLTRSIIRQIERARQAADLLANGTSILDTVYQAGYADQPHLTRSLKRFIGETPAQIARNHPPE